MKNILPYIALSLIFCGCWNPLNQAIKDLENAEFNNAYELITAKKAISFIENSELDSLKKMFPYEILKSEKDIEWEDIMINGSKAIESNNMPPDSLVEISNTINVDNGVKQIFAKLSFPFVTNNEDAQKMYINLITSQGKLYGLNVGEHPFGLRIVEPEYKEPHLNQHSVSYEAINWFRLWYGSGFTKNDYGDRYGYYAVSGDKEKMEKLSIQLELTQLFNLINTTTPDSTDFKYIREKSIGDPEYIYLRFKFDNAPYNKFGEFSIYHHLKDEPGKIEPMSKYITVKHSDMTRYLYLVEKNPKMDEILKTITYKRYDKHFERRWM